jgi:hypothetical protein
MLKKIWLMFWLFPLNFLGILNSKKYLGKYQDTDVYLWRFWIKGYSTAFGDRILLYDKHNEKQKVDKEYKIRLFKHEYKHIQQQKKIW